MMAPPLMVCCVSQKPPWRTLLRTAPPPSNAVLVQGPRRPFGLSPPAKMVFELTTPEAIRPVALVV